MPPQPSATERGAGTDARRYPERFYDRRWPGSLRSATLILNTLVDAGVPAPRAVVDVGCGRGAWLHACRELGADLLVGVDGPWNAPHFEPQTDIAFRSVDLERTSASGLRDAVGGRGFDLGVSVEVVEHLPDASGREVIDFLTSSCDLVLFSAAIPGQGGTHHRNEQWPSYWAAVFRSCGFEPFDLVRPRLWSNDEVEFWYRQNVVVYARPETLRPFTPANVAFLDIVHPRQLAHSRTTLSVLEAARALARAIARTGGAVVRAVLRR